MADVANMCWISEPTRSDEMEPTKTQKSSDAWMISGSDAHAVCQAVQDWKAEGWQVIDFDCVTRRGWWNLTVIYQVTVVRSAVLAGLTEKLKNATNDLKAAVDANAPAAKQPGSHEG